MKDKFPSNYAVLLSGPPGVGKFEYCLDLSKYYLTRGEKIVYITTERSPWEVKERGKSVGFDFSGYEGKSLLFIDGYSWSVGRKYDKGLSIDNPSNLNEMNVYIKKAVDTLSPPVRLIFDSVSPLFLHNPPGAVTKFFQVLTSRVKAEYGFILITMQEGVHDPQIVNTLKYLADGFIQMDFEEGKELIRKLRVHYLKGVPSNSGWIRFDLTEKGFKITPPSGKGPLQ